MLRSNNMRFPSRIFESAFPGLLLPGLLWVVLFPASAWAQFGAELHDKTTREFDKYESSSEAKMRWTPRYGTLAPGEVRIEPASGDGNTDIDDGIVHDWVAAAIVRDATVQQVIDLLQDYDEYPEMYTPEVQEARVISHRGNDWRVFLQMYKQKVLSATLNGEFDVQYRDRGRGRWTMVSRSTRIAEVDDGKELPVGKGHGFLWRLNAYWLVEPRPEGVYLEVRSMSLSRDVPFGLGMVIKPFITSVPRESLNDTMTNTVKELERRVALARRAPVEVASSKHPAVAE